MTTPVPQSDKDLYHLALQQVHNGDINAARNTAAQITDPAHQRSTWMGILYAQFYELKDLLGTKETVLSLSDTNLWKGTWVYDLVLFTAKSGDIGGAKTFVNRLQDGPRGMFLSLIASAQVEQGDYAGAEATQATIRPDDGWYDLSFLVMVRKMILRNDRIQAEILANRIHDAEIKASAMRFFDTPPSGD